jgi:hypothetical protein
VDDLLLRQIIGWGAFASLATIIMRARANQWRFGLGELLLFIAAASLVLWFLLQNPNWNPRL